IGYATQVVIAYAAVSYIVIQAWAFFYLFSSFSSEVPWASCSNFVSLECLMTSVTDMFPNVFRRGYRRELLLLGLCTACFLLGLLLVTERLKQLCVPENKNHGKKRTSEQCPLDPDNKLLPATCVYKDPGEVELHLPER
ncbi:hypothetical protein CRUP_006747, partial [Coryphaenoides rupestris]